MNAKATLLTADEAAVLAEELLAHRTDQTRDSTINMASGYLTSDGAVRISLLGVDEHHDSFSSFLEAYGLTGE